MTVQAWISLPWTGPTRFDGRGVREAVARWEEAGVAGAVQGDHLFRPAAPPGSDDARNATDCLTVLTMVAAHAERLAVGTLVANVGVREPVTLLRQFANLALVAGGERVYAGLGGGWAAREFEALGLPMPDHGKRLDRLEECLQLARTLFDAGHASFEGRYVQAVDLPLAPAPPSPPRLLLGGGSKRIVALAARFADHLDLAPPPRARADSQLQRPFATATADLEQTSAALTAALAEAGRPPTAVTRSVLLARVVFCRQADVASVEEQICASVGLPHRSLSDCPYVLIGEPAAMADALRERAERLRLAWVNVPADAIDRFCADVAPLL